MLVVATLLFAKCQTEESFSILPTATTSSDNAFYSIVEYSDDIILDVGDDWNCVDVLNPLIVKAGGWYNIIIPAGTVKPGKQDWRLREMEGTERKLMAVFWMYPRRFQQRKTRENRYAELDIEFNYAGVIR